MGVSGQHHAPAALYPWEWTPGTHCTGGWVGPRASLGAEARGTKMWREEILDKRFWNIDSEIGIRTITGCKNKDMWQKLGLYLSRYREKWERMIKKNECDDMSNFD
jgi:hypothetical protein